MEYKECMSLVKTIGQAALANKKHLLNHYKRNKQNDHSNIDKFQTETCNYLSKNFKTYAWKIEQQTNGRIEKDSIDILGNPINKNNDDYYNCIIEIDAYRYDQVATKFLSRLALWGKKEPIIYVALLYKQQSFSKNTAEKYVHYANEVIKLINSKSKVFGIYVDVDDDPKYDNHAEIWNFQKNCSSKIYKIGTNEYETMGDCASAVIKQYVCDNPQKTYKDLKDVFKKFIDSKRGPSRYNKIEEKGKNIKSKDGIDIYSYSQFRGNDKTWTSFVNICKKQGFDIETIWHYIR